MYTTNKLNVKIKRDELKKDFILVILQIKDNISYYRLNRILDEYKTKDYIKAISYKRENGDPRIFILLDKNIKLPDSLGNCIESKISHDLQNKIKEIDSSSICNIQIEKSSQNLIDKTPDWIIINLLLILLANYEVKEFNSLASKMLFPKYGFKSQSSDRTKKSAKRVFLEFSVNSDLMLTCNVKTLKSYNFFNQKDLKLNKSLYLINDKDPIITVKRNSIKDENNPKGIYKPEDIFLEGTPSKKFKNNIDWLSVNDNCAENINKQHYLYMVLYSLNKNFSKYVELSFKKQEFIQYDKSKKIKADCFLKKIISLINKGGICLYAQKKEYESYFSSITENLCALGVCRERISLNHDNVYRYAIHVVSPIEDNQSKDDQPQKDDYEISDSKIIQHICIDNVKKKGKVIYKVCLCELILKDELYFRKKIELFNYSQINKHLYIVSAYHKDKEVLYFGIEILPSGELRDFILNGEDLLFCKNDIYKKINKTFFLLKNEIINNNSVLEFVIFNKDSNEQLHYSVITKTDWRTLVNENLFEDQKKKYLSKDETISKDFINKSFNTFKKNLNSDSAINWLNSFNERLNELDKDTLSVKDFKNLYLHLNKNINEKFEEFFENAYVSTYQKKLKLTLHHKKKTNNIYASDNLIGTHVISDCQNHFYYYIANKAFKKIFNYNNSDVIREYYLNDKESLSFDEMILMCHIPFIRFGTEENSVYPFFCKYVHEIMHKYLKEE